MSRGRNSLAVGREFPQNKLCRRRSRIECSGRRWSNLPSAKIACTAGLRSAQTSAGAWAARLRDGPSRGLSSPRRTPSAKELGVNDQSIQAANANAAIQPIPALDADLCARAVVSCACFNFRKASRAVTQQFDELLQSTGLRSTQLVVLVAVAVTESPGVASLARELVMDRSTLTRNLRPLVKQGLLKVRLGKDRRTRVVEMTSLGRDVLAEALPVWEHAQNRFVTQLGEARWQELLSLLSMTVDFTWGQGGL
jgi:DNA-binding MarR family transcriptional regulator